MAKEFIAQDVFRAIKQYAAAYKRLELLQQSGLIPIGDQKTGAIAEFYAQTYAEAAFPDKKVTLGSASQAGWDILLKGPDGSETKIQVKAVSDFSKTRRVSPIKASDSKHGWDELWLLCLNTRLELYSFKVVQAKSVDWSSSPLTNKVMPGGEGNKSGSAEFRNAEDRTDAMLSALRRKQLVIAS